MKQPSASNREVRYDRLRPAEVVAARENCPVAWLPLGTIEWHGLHLPLGTDMLLSHGLAVRCAQAVGGLAFPAVGYGESRVEGLMEANSGDRQDIASHMRLPASNFEPAAFRTTPQDQFDLYQRLLLHTLNQLQTLGFKVAVLICGHFPLIDHAQAACCLFHQMRWENRRARMLTWAFCWPQLLLPEFPEANDHAGYGETSLSLALRPDCVDMQQLPADESQPLTAVLTARPVQQASAEFGERAARLIVERASAAVTDRLANPQAYYAHGWSAR